MKNTNAVLPSTVHRCHHVLAGRLQRAGRAGQRQEVQKESQPVPRPNTHIGDAQQAERRRARHHRVLRRYIRKLALVRPPVHTRGRTDETGYHAEVSVSRRAEVKKWTPRSFS